MATAYGCMSASESTNWDSLRQRLEELFQSIEGKDVLQRSITKAVDHLQYMLRLISLEEDPNNDIPDNSATFTPYLLPLPGGERFRLPSNDPLVLKTTFPRKWTVLSNEVANIPCSHLWPTTLLESLNIVFETGFTLTSGVKACLQEFIDDGCDFGQVYGYLRPWIPDIHSSDDFSGLPSKMRERKEKDSQKRSGAINTDRISSSRIPPRRVWDLYANRVIPYYAIDPHPKGWHYIPQKLWTVSHSWVSPSERKYVLTSVNGKAWRVPIPYKTTINDIRTELLGFGAEYVFLDVLCLRQKDDKLPQLESIRKKEWRLDVPTIGHVYHLYDGPEERPAIIYFNGLGLPFHDQILPEDRFHWFNRVWTIQETPRCAFLGGTTFKYPRIFVQDSTTWPASISRGFLQRLSGIRDNLNQLLSALQIVTSRSYSNPTDQIACLAYLLRCTTLPIYDADMDIEVAWSLLVECLPDETRTALLFLDIPLDSESSSWQPTWEQLVRVQPASRFQCPTGSCSEEHLKHLDASSAVLGYKNWSDAYYHSPYVIEGCRIIKERNLVEIPLARCSESEYGAFKVSAWGHSDSVDQRHTYLLISIGRLEHWIVARKKREWRIGDQSVFEVSKVCVITIEEGGNKARSKEFRYRVKGSTSRAIMYCGSSVGSSMVPMTVSFPRL